MRTKPPCLLQMWLGVSCGLTADGCQREWNKRDFGFLKSSTDFTWVTALWFISSLMHFSTGCEMSNEGLFPPPHLQEVFSQCVWSLRSLRRCSSSDRLYLITEDAKGNKSCQSWSQTLHISCSKCPQSKHSGQQDLPLCCSAVTQLSSTPFACCGNPFIFTIMSDLGADGRHRASCGF